MSRSAVEAPVSPGLADAGPELQGVRLEPPALEQEYRARFLDSDRRTSTVVLGLIVLSGIPSAMNDMVFAPTQIAWLWGLRAGVAVLALAVMVACWRATRPVAMDLLVLFGVSVASVESFLIQSTRPPDYLLPIIIEAASTILIWAVLPNRFVFQAISGLFLTLEATGWLVLFRRPLTRAEITVIAVTLISSNAIGAFVSWRSHRLRRTLFLEHRRLLAAKAEVTRLSSLLPICMYCKKIRDDDGHWEVLETYISERTTSKFSHGMCEDCFSTHGGED